MELIQFMNYDGERRKEVMKKNQQGLNMRRRKEGVCSADSIDFENII